MYLFYSAALALAALISAPWWLFQMARLGKYRAGLGERLGRVPARLGASQGPVIWIHAVSVGEALAVSELVNRLRARFPACRVVISTTTLTGQRLARERFGAGDVFYFPLDFAFAIRPYFRALRPAVVVLAETEFWPNFLRIAKSSGAKIVVTNARISDRSLPRYLRFRALMRGVLKNIDTFLAQSKTDAERLVQIGAPEERVSVAGNLKFEVKPPDPSTPLIRGLDIYLQKNSLKPVIVAGSTVEGEEALVVDAFRLVLKNFPKALLLLAPRHKERFEAVATELASAGIPLVRRSQLSSTMDEIKAGSVLLLDSIGELAAIYYLADITFVGGSLVPRGGHNILEPAYFGKPIVVGLHTENFRDIVAAFRAEDAVVECTGEELGARWLAILKDFFLRQQLGERAMDVFESRSGATDRTIEAIANAMEDAR